MIIYCCYLTQCLYREYRALDTLSLSHISIAKILIEAALNNNHFACFNSLKVLRLSTVSWSQSGPKIWMNPSQNSYHIWDQELLQ